MRVSAIVRTWSFLALFTALHTVASSVAYAQTCTAKVTRSLVAGGLVAPVDIRHAGDSRLFVVEQAGRIRIISGSLFPTPFLDIASTVVSGGERGLLSLAFHPNYPATPWFYVYYTNNDPTVGNVGDVVLARFSVTANPNVADPASRRVLLVIPHSSQSNHNGGQLQFNPANGYLYVSVGDGGAGCDVAAPGCNAQREDTLLGKILRLDVNTDVAPYYTIPPTNPFAAPASPASARDEIWAKGLRNPFRMSFDRGTGDLYVADVGQDTREEIDREPAGSPGGRNYGWKVMEGRACNTCDLNGCPAPLPACNDPSLTLPIHEYDHTVGVAVIGGYVYRGASVPSLEGCYLFGDIGGARSVWALDPASPSARNTLFTGVVGFTTFGEDLAGEVYVASGNAIYRIVHDPAAVPASGTVHLALAFGVFTLLGAFVIGRRRFLAART